MQRTHTPQEFFTRRTEKESKIARVFNNITTKRITQQTASAVAFSAVELQKVVSL